MILPERPRILIITLRRLGDVLLTTPLIRALKLGFSGCVIDALVFRGTEGMLAGNGDLDDADSPSRELARAIEEIDGRSAIRMIFRQDRYGRGGDH